MKDSVDKIPRLVRQLFQIVREMEDLFPGRKFTPDGHLVGSLGEVIAADRYGLELLPASAETHDARTEDGRLVQIKATQGRTIGIRSEPEWLIVLHISKSGEFEEVYNGRGKPVWEVTGRMQKNGQPAVSVARMKELMLCGNARLPRRRD